MDDDKTKRPSSEEDNYDELLKNFLPASERRPAEPRPRPQADTADRSSADVQEGHGVYFSPTKNKPNPTETKTGAYSPTYPAQSPIDRQKHILIPPTQEDTFPEKSATERARRYDSPVFPADGAPDSTDSRRSYTRRFPVQPADADDASQTRRRSDTAERKTDRPAPDPAAKRENPEKRKEAEKPINKKKGSRRKTKRKSRSAKYNAMVRLVICLASVALLIGASALIKIPLMECINDVLAIDGTDDEVSVTITEGMSTKEIIDMLGQKGLVNSPLFCNIISDFLGYDKDTEYPAGTYTLTSEMGVEGMLAEIVAAGKDTRTITLTFPEGYTVEQIIARLASNGVASTGSLYAAISDYEFSGMFEYLNNIRNINTRFNALEGYLYPDTYDFYVGENPNSVIKKFLANFEEKWTDVYSERAEDLGLSLDNVLTMASIIEKEANDAQQMPIVASVLYNRLGAAALYPHLECDSTTDYVEKLYEDSKINNAEYYSLLMLYDTYQVNGLPEGPICNPGGDAIKAALYPDSTLYYYFMHDSAGQIYLASTAEEHAANAVAAGIR